MPVVNVRIPQEDLAYLHSRNANVDEVIRTALEKELHWMRLQEAQANLDRRRFRPSRPGEDLLREDRDRA